jgi:hypothetical protein
VDETDYNLWLDALSDTLEIREMAIQVGTSALRVCLSVPTPHTLFLFLFC